MSGAALPPLAGGPPLEPQPPQRPGTTPARPSEGARGNRPRAQSRGQGRQLTEPVAGGIWVQGAKEGLLTAATVDYLIGQADVSYRADGGAHAGSKASCRWEEDTVRAALIGTGSHKGVEAAPNSFLAAALGVCQQQQPAATAEGPPSIVPREYWLYSESPLRHAFRGDKDAEYDAAKGIWRKRIFPSVKPTGRIEVFLLARTLDRMMGVVDTSVVTDADACYSADSDAFSSTFRKLFEVYNTGFGEIIRQVYIQCAERGVLLDRVRSLYSDFAENCFDIVDYLKSQLRRRQQQQKKAEELVSTARADLKTARHQEGLLRSEVASLKSQLEEVTGKLVDQTAMERRDQLMRRFLENQAERNAMLLQIQDVGSADGDADSQSGQEKGERAESTVSVGTPGAESPQLSTEQIGTMRQLKSGKQGMQKQRGAKKVEPDPWDEALYEKLVLFCDHMRKAVSSCEAVTADFYGKLVYNNPMQSASWARDKLQRIVQTHVLPVVQSPTGAGPTPEELLDRVQPGVQVAPLEGSFEVTKQMLCELLGDVVATLKEVVTRLSTYAASSAAEHRLATVTGGPASPRMLTVAEADTPVADALQYCVEWARAVATGNMQKADELLDEAVARGAYAGDVLGASYRAILQRLGSVPSPRARPSAVDTATSPRALSPRGAGRASDASAESQPHDGAARSPRSPREGRDISGTRDGGTSPRPDGGSGSRGGGSGGGVLSPRSAGAGSPRSGDDLRTALREKEITIEKLRAAEAAARRQADEEVERGQAALDAVEQLSEHWQGELQRIRKAAEAAGVTLPGVRTPPTSPVRIRETLSSPRSPKPEAPDARAPVIIRLHFGTKDKGRQDYLTSPRLRGMSSSSRSPGVLSPASTSRGGGVLGAGGRGRSASSLSPDQGGQGEDGRRMSRQGTRERLMSTRRTQEERGRDRDAARLRRRQRGMQVQNERLRQILANFKDYTPKLAQWAFRAIAMLYKTKSQGDSCVPPGQPVMTMPEHMFDHLRQKHGARKLVDEYCGSLLATSQKYREDPRADLFCRFVSEEYPVILLSLFLKYSRTLDEAKVGPEYFRGADDGAELAPVSLIRALFVVGMTETDQQLIADVTAEIQAAAVECDWKTYRDAMLRTGYSQTALQQVPQQWGCDEVTARKKLPRAVFLTIVVRAHAKNMGIVPSAANEPTSEEEDNTSELEPNDDLSLPGDVVAPALSEEQASPVVMPVSPDATPVSPTA